MKNNIFRNKIILVTGGTGSIGSEIVKTLLAYKPKEIRVYSRDEYKHFLLQQELSHVTNIVYIIGDVRDRDRLNEAMGGVHIVFHAAAMKHVSFCEENPDEAIKTNVIGSKNVVLSAVSNNVKRVIGISTDKAANPTTFMGKTKATMEHYLLSKMAKNTIFSIVRLGNIINSRGSVIPLWMDQIHRGLDITITDKKMKRYLMEASEAAELIVKYAMVAIGSEIFVIKMEEKNIFDLSQKIIKKYGRSKKIKIQIIGSRYGEKLTEELLTDEEINRSIERYKYYIVLPTESMINERRGLYD